jgi:hypothetical protein
MHRKQEGFRRRRNATEDASVASLLFFVLANFFLTVANNSRETPPLFLLSVLFDYPKALVFVMAQRLLTINASESHELLIRSNAAQTSAREA